jgi:hypothetical protein
MNAKMLEISQLEAQQLRMAVLAVRKGALPPGTVLRLEWIGSKRLVPESQGGKLTHLWQASGLTPNLRRLECFVTEHDLDFPARLIY